MTRDEAVSIIKGRLARWNDTVLTNHIIVELKQAQQRAEMDATLPWFLLTESSYAATVVDEERVEVPADFLREAEEDALWLEATDGTWVQLKKDDYASIRNRWTESDQPRRYALVGEYFRLRPVPDAVYNLHMIYYGKDAVLSTNIENKWLLHTPELLIADAGAIIAARYVRNEPAAAEFRADYQRARTQMMTMNQARLDANRVYGSDN